MQMYKVLSRMEVSMSMDNWINSNGNTSMFIGETIYFSTHSKRRK